MSILAKISKLSNGTYLLILTVIFIMALTYSFSLAMKRYQNYEYGKFDLGNMAQMVWNTSRGDFMEVTDQFGTNMPRWGMSHVDPVLVLFVPIYWIVDHPMVLVFLQHILVLSAIYPLYWLTFRKLNSRVTALLVVLSYIFYPAIGYTLIWTTYHGISFVAPLLIWLIYFLEKKEFLNEARFKDYLIYWTLIVLMLFGKEEIGFLLAIGAIFLRKYNLKLATSTFVVSAIWSLICFFMIIPGYAGLRESGINHFIETAGIEGASPESVQGENFFLTRYSYLGSSYSEIARNMILRPDLVFKVVFSDHNLKAINNLVGPFGYVVVIVPFWLMTLPDLAILVLSKENIFAIDNHRVAFIISALFICYIYLLSMVNDKLQNRVRFFPLVVVIAICVFILNIWFSYKSENPLFISGVSFVQEKIIKKISAQETPHIVENDSRVGEQMKAQIPRNNITCLDKVFAIVEEKNPQIYSGPDYLGAHTANRKVNALFPAGILNSDLIVVDIFDEKALDRVGVKGWMANKEALTRLTSSGRYHHYYSCGMISVFESHLNDMAYDDVNVVVSYVPESNDIPQMYGIETSSMAINVGILNFPESISINDPNPIELALMVVHGNFYDKVTFWEFRKTDGSAEYAFLDYLTSGSGLNPNTIIPEEDYIKETYFPRFDSETTPGEYEVYYGIGDLVRASKIYLGKVNITK